MANKIRLIAETAWHYDGDIDFFKKLVQSITDNTNTDYIKFHLTFDIDEYMHHDHPAYQWAKVRLISVDQWESIINLALIREKKLMFLFNDMDAIDFGMRYNPEIVEIHSVCLNDFRLLSYLKSKVNENTKIVLGVGGSDLYEIEYAINILDSPNIILMHGFQNYPTKYEDINFGKIKKIIQLYPRFAHGYADHTAWDNENNTLITLFGAALGMEYIEKHVTICLGEQRTDWQAAISIEKFNDLTHKLRLLETTYGSGDLNLNAGEKTYSTFGANKKAAILLKNVMKGDNLTKDIYSFKRTGQKSDLSQVEVVNLHGKAFSKDCSQGHCIVRFDIE